MSDLNTSILVNRQVPEFVREEHPKFISFLEAYYEFLNNTTYGKAKDLRNISDVDETLNEFETQFFNTFAPFVNKDAALSKEKLFKNILPLYLAKGSEKSFQLLFRMLFGEEIELDYPKNQVLRASDGKWTSQNILRLETIVFSEYICDGEKNVFYLPYVLSGNQIQVYLNGSLISNYELRKESKKIILTNTPNLNDILKINYENFDITVVQNRKITGKSSGTTAIVETSSVRNTSGLSFYQFLINTKTLFGVFENGEFIECDLIADDTNGQEKIPLTFQSFADLESITITNSGANYKVGDPVVIRGESQVPAAAIVDSVTTGTIQDLVIVKRGAGYKFQNPITANGYATSGFFAQVLTVDDSGINSLNTISYNQDTISNYLNITLNSSDYGFPANTDGDINAVISTVLTSNTINNLGSITSINVVNSQISSAESPTFLIKSSNITSNLSVSDLRAIGSLNIISGGSNYQIGDTLNFIDLSFSGAGASAYVSNVSLTGAITEIKFTSGGLLYDQNNLPYITITSASGINANVVVDSLMGSGAVFNSLIDDGVSGQILSIRILNSGVGYFTIPAVDLSFSGDGTATAVANIRNSFVSIPGRWETGDSLLSSEEIRLQGLDYYLDYSYVIKSSVEFKKYKSILKNLIHPIGFKNFAVYKVEDLITTNTNYQSESLEKLAVSGTVNVTSNTIVVTGINTYFVKANTLNIINVGTTISVNNEVRNVVSISSNTSFNVDTAFINTSNNQFIRILT